MMDLDDEEFKATRILNGVDKENKINDFIKIYNEIKEQSAIIGNINKEFFLELIKTINIVEKEKSDWIKAYQEEKDKQFNILRDSIPKQKIIDILNKYKYVSIDDTEQILQFYEEFKNLVENK